MEKNVEKKFGDNSSFKMETHGTQFGCELVNKNGEFDGIELGCVGLNISFDSECPDHVILSLERADSVEEYENEYTLNDDQVITLSKDELRAVLMYGAAALNKIEEAEKIAEENKIMAAEIGGSPYKQDDDSQQK